MIILIITVTNIQCTNTTSVISKSGIFSPFFSLAILLLVLPRNFIVSKKKNSLEYLKQNMIH